MGFPPKSAVFPNLRHRGGGRELAEVQPQNREGQQLAKTVSPDRSHFYRAADAIIVDAGAAVIASLTLLLTLLLLLMPLLMLILLFFNRSLDGNLATKSEPQLVFGLMFALLQYSALQCKWKKQLQDDQKRL